MWPIEVNEQPPGVVWLGGEVRRLDDIPFTGELKVPRARKVRQFVGCRHVICSCLLPGARDSNMETSLSVLLKLSFKGDPPVYDFETARTFGATCSNATSRKMEPGGNVRFSALRPPSSPKRPVPPRQGDRTHIRSQC